MTGYLVSKTHPFGLPVQKSSNEVLNVIGAVLAVASLVCYFFVKTENQQVEDDDHPAAKKRGAEPLLAAVEEAYDVKPPTVVPERTLADKIVGAALAMASGVCYGFCLVPSQKWHDQRVQEANRTGGKQPSPFDFVFSQCVGIYALSTVAFIVYVIVKGNKPLLYPSTTLPAIVSGGMWSIANAAFIFANAKLGLSAYPIICLSPCWIASAWSVFVFKEIKGKNLGMLAVSLAVNFAAVMCLAFSQPKK